MTRRILVSLLSIWLLIGCSASVQYPSPPTRPDNPEVDLLDSGPDNTESLLLAAADLLLGTEVKVPRWILQHPGKLWDVLDRHGIAEGDRPEDTPAPEDNETRMTEKQLRELAKRSLGSRINKVRINWPVSFGTTD